MNTAERVRQAAAAFDAKWPRGRPGVPGDVTRAIRIEMSRPVPALTNDGRPDCRRLSAMLGRTVTAAERNQAWEQRTEVSHGETQ